jgi:hypothetical protein
MRRYLPDTRWLALAALALVAAIVAVTAERPGTRPAHADTTNMAVIACENIAPLLDGDADDATTQADLDLACEEALPATGALSIATLAADIGDADGTLEYADILPIDALDNNRIPAHCTYEAVVTNATKAAEGCTLLVFVFVDDESSVTFDLPSSLASIETGGDVTCNTDGDGLGIDNDCQSSFPANHNGDGVVVFHLLNGTAADGEGLSFGASQEAVEQTADINISSQTRDDANGDIDGDGIAYPADNCPYIANPDQLNTDNAPLVTPGVAVADTSIANGDRLGDVCDDDIDNDDQYETSNQVPPSPPPACPLTDPLLADTDGDPVLDGAECLLGSDPTNALSRPILIGSDSDGDGLEDGLESDLGSDPNDVDSDDDGITDGVEVKGYNTSPSTVDTDADGCSDGAEIASVDGLAAINSIDLQLIAQAFLQTDKPAFDINKDGNINSIDLQITAQNFNPAPCNSPG